MKLHFNLILILVVASLQTGVLHAVENLAADPGSGGSVEKPKQSPLEKLANAAVEKGKTIAGRAAVSQSLMLIGAEQVFSKTVAGLLIPATETAPAKYDTIPQPTPEMVKAWEKAAADKAAADKAAADKAAADKAAADKAAADKAAADKAAADKAAADKAAADKAAAAKAAAARVERDWSIRERVERPSRSEPFIRGEPYINPGISGEPYLK